MGIRAQGRSSRRHADCLGFYAGAFHRLGQLGLQAASTAARQGLLYARRARLRIGCPGLHRHDESSGAEDCHWKTPLPQRGGGVGLAFAQGQKVERDAVAKRSKHWVLQQQHHGRSRNRGRHGGGQAPGARHHDDRSAHSGPRRLRGSNAQL